MAFIPQYKLVSVFSYKETRSLKKPKLLFGKKKATFITFVYCYKLQSINKTCSKDEGKLIL